MGKIRRVVIHQVMKHIVPARRRLFENNGTLQFDLRVEERRRQVGTGNKKTSSTEKLQTLRPGYQEGLVIQDLLRVRPHQQGDTRFKTQPPTHIPTG